MNNIINYSISNNNLLFSNNSLKWIIIISSFSPLIIGILSIIGGISVFLMSIICLLIFTPLVYFCNRLIKIDGLYLAFIFCITVRLLFLLLKIITLYQDPNMAMMIGGDSINYHNDIYDENDTRLLLSYGVDIGFLYFLKFISSTFNVLQNEIPIIFVIPNIFASAFFMIFSVMFAKSLFLEKNIHYVFWIATLDPISIIYSTVIMKDVLVAFMIGFSFILFKKYKGQINFPFQIIVWFFASMVAFLLRWRAIGIISGIISLRLIFSNNLSRARRGLLISIISLSVMLFSLVEGRAVNVMKVINKGKSIVSTESDIRGAVVASNQEDSRNVGRLGTIINNIDSFPLRTTARSIMSFLAPIPPMQFYQFEWGDGINSRQARIIRDLGGIYWYIMMPLLILGLIIFLRGKNYFLPLSFFLVIFAMGLSGWVDPRIRLMAIIPTHIFIYKGLIEYSFWNRISLSFYFLLIIFWLIYELLY